MSAIMHFRHETKAGKLKIEYNSELPSCASDDVHRTTMIKLVFEDGETGAFYDGEFAHSELCKLYPVFHMRDEIPDILGEIPWIMQNIAGPSWEGICGRAVSFKYTTARGREYPIILPLKPREYPKEQKDIVELRAENAMLRKKLTAQDNRIANLEKRCETYDKWFSTIAECQWPGEIHHHQQLRYEAEEGNVKPDFDRTFSKHLPKGILILCKNVNYGNIIE